MADSLQKQCALLAFHRWGEIQGLRLLFAMIRHLADADARAELARQAADEARHLWLLSKQIAELDPALLAAQCAGMPRPVALVNDAAGLLAVAHAVKQRALRRYAARAAWLTPEAVELREAIAADERAHLAWLARRLALSGPASDGPAPLRRYLEAEEAAFAALAPTLG